jgi:hypothetical protein
MRTRFIVVAWMVSTMTLGSCAHDQVLSTEARNLYKLEQPRFIYGDSTITPDRFPAGDLVLVAGADVDRDVVYVFVSEAELLVWARTTEHGEIITRAVSEMEAARRNAPESNTVVSGPRNAGVLNSLSFVGSANPWFGGVGWLYNDNKYAGRSRPMAPYPKLKSVGINNSVSSAWVVGFAILCDAEWYGGTKIYLLGGIGVPQLSVLNFDNRASSVWF